MQKVPLVCLHPSAVAQPCHMHTIGILALSLNRLPYLINSTMCKFRLLN